MTADQEHVVLDDLAKFAFAPNSESPEFERVRAHLASGCRLCALQFAAFKPRRITSPGETRRPADWIVPSQVLQRLNKRSGALADYQIVCGAGDYELDVIVREMEAPQRLDIGGQVTRAMALHDPARDVAMYLVEARGDDVVSTTRTDEFGEFDFEAHGSSRWGLRVGDDGDAPCVLVWEGAA